MTSTQKTAAEGRAFPAGTLAWDPVARAPAAEDRLVNSAFQFLTAPNGLIPERARDLGRALGRSAQGGELHAFVEAFSHLGLGQLRIVSEAADRVLFESPDLLGGEKAKAASCALALGFVEGVTSRTRDVPMLGAEISCRSRGHAHCAFVVMRKR